ncbi:hypothetical protein D3C80_1159390 [compost metagenome]
MLVPPPICAPISRRSGACSWLLASTTSSANSSRRVRTALRRAKMPAITALWITDSLIEPLWSTTSHRCQGSRRSSRGWKNSRSSTSSPLSTWPLFN